MHGLSTGGGFSGEWIETATISLSGIVVHLSPIDLSFPPKLDVFISFLTLARNHDRASRSSLWDHLDLRFRLVVGPSSRCRIALRCFRLHHLMHVIVSVNHGFHCYIAPLNPVHCLKYPARTRSHLKLLIHCIIASPNRELCLQCPMRSRSRP